MASQLALMLPQGRQGRHHCMSTVMAILPVSGPWLHSLPFSTFLQNSATCVQLTYVVKLLESFPKVCVSHSWMLAFRRYSSFESIKMQHLLPSSTTGERATTEIPRRSDSARRYLSVVAWLVSLRRSMAKFSCFTLCGHGLSSYQPSLAPQPFFQHFSAQYCHLRAANTFGKAPRDLSMHVCCVSVAACIEELQHFCKHRGEGKTGRNRKECSRGNSGKRKTKAEEQMAVGKEGKEDAARKAGGRR